MSAQARTNPIAAEPLASPTASPSPAPDVGFPSRSGAVLPFLRPPRADDTADRLQVRAEDEDEDEPADEAPEADDAEDGSGDADGDPDGEGGDGETATGSRLGTEALADLELVLSVRLGEVDVPLSELLQYDVGQVVELDSRVSDPVLLMLNEKVIAEGQLVMAEERLAFRVGRILSPENRMCSDGAP